jgi:hypothetical protein
LTQQEKGKRKKEKGKKEKHGSVMASSVPTVELP